MSLFTSPKIVTNGLIFYYDMNNRKKSWRGAPTTNLSSGSGISIYNNVPSDVTAALSTTGDFYEGAPIYKLILTPTTASGVSYLTAGNNPGIGVVTGGGGGLANRYTGHSIFFKSFDPLHTSPIFTHYSNIVGYQSTTNYDVIGDGWFRAHVIWYDTVTRSDGKYWAINPASATLNVPITIYWAAPFKEDSNYSGHVSAYSGGTRSSTQSLIDLTNNYTLTGTNIIYNSNGTFSFNNSYFDLNSANIITGNNPFTVESWYTTSAASSDEIFGNYGSGATSGTLWVSGRYGTYINGAVYFPGAPLGAGTYHLMTTRDGAGNVILYLNGNQVNSGVLASSIPVGFNFRIGADVNGGAEPFTGSIHSVRVYNRVLSAGEVKQNFNAQRGRYGV